MKSRRPVVLALSLALTSFTAGAQAPATHAGHPPAAPATTVNAATSEQLNALFEQYFEEYLKMNPLLATYIGDNRYNDQLPNFISPEYLARQHDMNERYLAAIRKFDPATLSGEDRISYEIFLRERMRQQESERFPDQLLPLAQTGGLPTMMPSLGSGRTRSRSSRCRTTRTG